MKSGNTDIGMGIGFYTPMNLCKCHAKRRTIMNFLLCRIYCPLFNATPVTVVDFDLQKT